jgi:hypothetical protein
MVLKPGRWLSFLPQTDLIGHKKLFTKTTPSSLKKKPSGLPDGFTLRVNPVLK